MTSLLESGDKTINQIQSILQSREVKNISKQVTEAIKDLAMAFRNDGEYKRKQTDMKSTTTTTRLAISDMTATSLIKD